MNAITVYNLLAPKMGEKPTLALLKYIERLKHGEQVQVEDTVDLYDQLLPTLEVEASKALIVYLHDQFGYTCIKERAAWYSKPN